MKKVLIITYYWPPSGGPGVQRILKFCKYLPEFDWKVFVLTVNNGEYPNIDYSLNKESDTLNIKVIKTKTFEPFKLYKWISRKKSIPSYELNYSKMSLFSRIGNWIRMNFYIPDARKGWIPYGVKAGKELIKNKKIDIIFSSGPPQSLHFIAKRLKDEFLIPWIADFRDPWTDLFYYTMHRRLSFIKQKDIELESKILSSANSLTVVSQGLKNLYTDKNPELKINVVHNGFDEEDFQNLEPDKVHKDKIIISYLGNMALSQVPYKFFKAISELIQSGKKIEIKIIGQIHSDAITEIKKNNLQNFIRHIGYKPHREALLNLMESNFLLLVVPRTPQNNLIITGKLFEYLRSGIRIIAIGPRNGDAAAIIRKTNSGMIFGYNETSALKNYIISPPNKEKSNIENYNRKNLTEKLSRIFDQELEINNVNS